MATYYWVGGSGTWDNSSKTNWATSSGGTGGAAVPTTGDTVNFDSNSGTAAVVTVAATAACAACTINKSDINLSLSGSPTFTGTTTFTAGTITLNNNTYTASRFITDNSNARTIAFGTGKIALTNNSVTLWSAATITNLVLTGTPVVEYTANSASGSRTFTHGSAAGLSETNTPSLNVTAGTDAIVIATNGGVKNLNFTGFSGSFSSSAFTIYGNLTISTGMTVTGGANATTFAATSGTQTITSNNKTYDRPITINGVGGSVELIDALAQGSSRAFTLTNGTFNAKNQNVTVGTFALGGGTKTLTLGSGTWTVAGSGASAWNANTNVTGLTVSASTGTISMTSASAKTFSGGAKVWPTLNQGGAGTLTIAQSNTFANITNTVQPATVTLTAGTTQTVTSLGLAGTSGNLITLNSSVAGTKATIYKASGSVSLSFVSIKDIAATGGANFNAFTSSGCVDGGNNTGWDFNSALYPTIYTVRKTKRYFLN